MPFASTENQTLSVRSLQGLHTKIKRATFSYPFVKPNLQDEQHKDFVKLFKTFEKVCQQGFKKCACKSTEQPNVTLEESKQIIRELAVELDRVIQFKKSPLMSGKLKNKGTKEEQQYYILQWAEDLKHDQIQQTEDKEKSPNLSEEYSDSEIQLKKAIKILTDWYWKLKQMKQNSVRPKGEYEETLRDLHKQWKQRESSILPVMDWMVWTVLHLENSEDLVPRQWMKKKQMSKNSAGLYIPNSVWKWITKSTADVILDPNTANPDLLVSEDGKAVITRTISDNWEEFQMKRYKFDGWTCVQAKEGYKTGRHYWEVDVRWKCEWRVGVVKESAPRNGFVTMNTNKGYWNLRLQLGTVNALTEPVTKLNLQKPPKIGVYLDMEEGHVSFYDPEKRRHIYTFIFNETETIYPMFGTVETDRALVISS